MPRMNSWSIYLKAPLRTPRRGSPITSGASCWFFRSDKGISRSHMPTLPKSLRQLHELAWIGTSVSRSGRKIISIETCPESKILAYFLSEPWSTSPFLSEILYKSNNWHSVLGGFCAPVSSITPSRGARDVALPQEATRWPLGAWRSRAVKLVLVAAFQSPPPAQCNAQLVKVHIELFTAPTEPAGSNRLSTSAINTECRTPNAWQRSTRARIEGFLRPRSSMLI